MKDNTYEKDYMGVITWGRLQCGAPQPMFGSDIKTDSPVYIRICNAYVSDMGGTPTDQHIHGKHPAIIEVEMTPIQWAEFLTAGHVDDGVPCTITRLNGKGMSRVEMRNVAEEYGNHINEKFEDFQKGIKRFEDEIEQTLESGKSMGKTQMKELLHSMKCFRENAPANLKYAHDRFREDMANMVVKAKAEINAYAELRLGDYGVKCLMNDNSAEIKPAIEEE